MLHLSRHDNNSSCGIHSSKYGKFEGGGEVLCAERFNSYAYQFVIFWLLFGAQCLITSQISTIPTRVSKVVHFLLWFVQWNPHISSVPGCWLLELGHFKFSLEVLVAWTLQLVRLFEFYWLLELCYSDSSAATVKTGFAHAVIYDFDLLYNAIFANTNLNSFDPRGVMDIIMEHIMPHMLTGICAPVLSTNTAV